jgi:hypothetical protein
MTSIDKAVLLSTAYMPPIHYFTKFFLYKNIYIEGCENYSKQSFRNRCDIATANGILALTIPVVHAEGQNKIPIREVLIDNDKRWKAIHKKAIESAYRSSPFFIYYADDLFNLIDASCEKLFDFNASVLKFFLEQMEIKPQINITTDYKAINGVFDDWSDGIHPKPSRQKEDQTYEAKPYYQVFQQKHSFIANLSILDALFNLGPGTGEYIKSCIKNDS